ncbi:Uncharacterised protein [Salmonella enterica subsp. enterica serovar Bovismorbificans]|uniref:Uncharacterized protein n=1 Tax=Salmonella enterica subsp. enterica serovar Bovismorbificans TaxID=58097 RepID=A0A655D949_SALET|nr:Uncharacterised protein [Salmonella enterica subsp. enterica serovar Bovismorbificans]
MNKQAEYRTQQLRVVKMGVGFELWQSAPQRDGHQRHQRRRYPKYGAPTAEVCQQSGDRSRQQDPQQQAAHNGADHFTAGGGRRKRGGQRNQNLRHHGEQSG